MAAALLLALTLSGFGTGALPAAQAGGELCEFDPTLTVDGHEVRIVVTLPSAALGTEVNPQNPIQFLVFVHPGAQVSIQHSAHQQFESVTIVPGPVISGNQVGFDIYAPAGRKGGAYTWSYYAQSQAGGTVTDGQVHTSGTGTNNIIAY